MSRVALVTAEAARGADDDETALLDALIWGGVDAGVVAWDDRSVDWASFDLAVVRSTWDYVPRQREFVRWLRRVSLRSTLANAAEVIEWNLDKHYLRDLQHARTPVVPTTWIEPGDVVRLPDRGELVVKPTVSSGARDTMRYHLPDHGDDARRHIEALLAAKRPVMVQPYLPSVDSDGEKALIFIDGVFSHAVRKGPILAEPKMSPTGLFAAEDVVAAVPTVAERATADAVMHTIRAREPVLYARIDLVNDLHGQPLVLEVELIEPSLFLGYGDGAVERFAGAISAWAGR